MVLLPAQGVPNAEIGRQVGMTRQTVIAWPARYDSGGIDALADVLRSGRPPVIDESAVIAYPLKDRVGAVADIAAAVEQVAAGQTVVDPDVVRQLIRRRLDPLQRLSPREQEVLALMAEGRSNATIGTRLHISDAAVNKHVGSISTKLACRSPPTATAGSWPSWRICAAEQVGPATPW